SILSSCGAQRSSVSKGAPHSLPPMLPLAPRSSIHRPARFDRAFGLSPSTLLRTRLSMLPWSRP
ncbi:MAG: hypothetical protein MUP64_14740, partial [Anaerolineae bacterium]|nr:hypothetical protein [Anaerolineae bacterium]